MTCACSVNGIAYSTQFLSFLNVGFVWFCAVNNGLCFVLSTEYPDISYDSYRNKGNLLGHYTQSTNFYSPISDFCTEDNIPECILYLNQVSDN